MKIDEYFSDKQRLTKKLSFFVAKKQLIKINPNPDLVKAWKKQNIT